MKNNKCKLILDLQFFASKKGVGSTKNGRDSQPKYLGAKKGDGQKVKAGQIIYRQRGTRIHPGANVGIGVDHTLFAKISGVVSYKRFGANKTKAIVTGEETPAK